MYYYLYLLPFVDSYFFIFLFIFLLFFPISALKMKAMLLKFIVVIANFIIVRNATQKRTCMPFLVYYYFHHPSLPLSLLSLSPHIQFSIKYLLILHSFSSSATSNHKPVVLQDMSILHEFQYSPSGIFN